MDYIHGLFIFQSAKITHHIIELKPNFIFIIESEVIIMLKNLRNEIRFNVMYCAVFYLYACIVSNGGIDKYLLDSLTDNLEAVPLIMLTSVTIMASKYVWKIVSRQIKIDVTEMKNELKVNKEEIKA